MYKINFNVVKGKKEKNVCGQRSARSFVIYIINKTDVRISKIKIKNT